MGQKTNPISNRLGIIRGWDSNWYGGTDYAGKILEDAKIRVQSIMVGQGRSLKRIRTAPQGRAARIRKRSNHVTIVLGKKSQTVKEEQK